MLVECLKGKMKAEQGIHFIYWTIMPKPTLQIGLLLDYKASGPLASTNLKYVFQALRAFVY